MKTKFKALENLNWLLILLAFSGLFFSSCGRKLSDAEQKVIDKKLTDAISLLDSGSFQSAYDKVDSLIDDKLIDRNPKYDSYKGELFALKAGCLLAQDKTDEAWEVYTSWNSLWTKAKVTNKLYNTPTPAPKTVSTNYFIRLNKRIIICNAILDSDIGKDIAMIKKLKDQALKAYEESSKLP